nr:unnamed protein product [Spirometra erinaceieuropaei]
MEDDVICLIKSVVAQSGGRECQTRRKCTLRCKCSRQARSRPAYRKRVVQRESTTPLDATTIAGAEASALAAAASAAGVVAASDADVVVGYVAVVVVVDFVVVVVVAFLPACQPSAWKITSIKSNHWKRPCPVDTRAKAAVNSPSMLDASELIWNTRIQHRTRIVQQEVTVLLHPTATATADADESVDAAAAAVDSCLRCSSSHQHRAADNACRRVDAFVAPTNVTASCARSPSSDNLQDNKTVLVKSAPLSLYTVKQITGSEYSPFQPSSL